MSKMVSARIPDALFDQGCARLEELGATQTQLVKAAFDYLLEERSPRRLLACAGDYRRRLAEQRQVLAAKLASCQLDIDIPTDVAYAKETAHQMREAKYEAVS
ncbi:MAG: hypothetical protein ACLSGS_06500 [Adlercreutzia sp.]